MGKTYRHVAWKDNIRYAKWSKRMASKAVRRHHGQIPDGYSFLKKIYNPYNIHDYRCVYYTRKEVEKRTDSRWGSNTIKRSPFLYKEKLFKRETIRTISL